MNVIIDKYLMTSYLNRIWGCGFHPKVNATVRIPLSPETLVCLSIGFSSHFVHSKCFTLQVSIHTITHTFMHSGCNYLLMDIP